MWNLFCALTYRPCIASVFVEVCTIWTLATNKWLSLCSIDGIEVWLANPRAQVMIETGISVWWLLKIYSGCSRLDSLRSKFFQWLHNIYAKFSCIPPACFEKNIMSKSQERINIHLTIWKAEVSWEKSTVFLPQAPLMVLWILQISPHLNLSR